MPYIILMQYISTRTTHVPSVNASQYFESKIKSITIHTRLHQPPLLMDGSLSVQQLVYS